MKTTVYVVDGSEFRTEITKRVKNTVKRGQVHSETIRTSKVVPYGFDVEIIAKPGITATHERDRVRDALRLKAAYALAALGLAVDCPQFNDIRRRSDGSYIFNEPKVIFEFVAKLEDGTSVHLGTDKSKATKRAAKLAIARETRVVELIREAA